MAFWGGRPRQGKNYSQMGWIGGSNILQLAQEAIVRIEFLTSFAIPSSSSHENVAKCCKDFLVYFNTLETHRVIYYYLYFIVLCEKMKC